MSEEQDVVGREETPLERADRNWTELTQELRVTQTGVQILTAFLLIVPFQARFPDLSTAQHQLYLVLVSFGFLTTMLMVAPVSVHRALFQRGQKMVIVRIANRITVLALASLAVLVAGTVALVFSVVIDGTAAWVAGVLAGVVLILLWVVMPWRVRYVTDQDPQPSR